MTIKRRPVEERFWEKVDKNGHTMPHMDTPCWVWTACENGAGYGAINMGGKFGKVERSHRVSWIIHFGPILDDMFICHKCDNRLCVRPDHLFQGTCADNNHDMQRKGRYDRLKRPKGERHGMVKLTDTDILDIRAKYDRSKPILKVLAQEYNVSLQNIHRIVKRKIWKHI